MRKLLFITLIILLFGFLISPVLAEAATAKRILKYNDKGEATIISTCTSRAGYWNCMCQGSNEVNNCYVGKIITDPICACCGDCTLSNAIDIGINITQIILKYLGVFVLAMFIIGGIVWLTSGGSQTRVKLGKDIIVGALVGLIIVLFAYLIIQTVLKWVATPDYELKESAKKQNKHYSLVLNNFDKNIYNIYEKNL